MQSQYFFACFVCILKIAVGVWYHCGPSDYECECDKTERTCETSLIIENKLIMVDPISKNIVYPKGNKLYKFGDHTTVSPTNIVTADGWYNTSRIAVVANGTMPGPPLIVYEGQQLFVNVINKLHSEQVTIHWHGLPQKGSEYMDGVPFLSQCPIETGLSFLYNFTATPKGTYWYHSHSGLQRGKGLFGPLIIRERNPVEVFHEHILTVMEWNHFWDSDVDLARHGGINFHPSDPAKESFNSGLVNGKGRFNNNEAPLEVFNVTKGERYRFRLIGTSTVQPFEISIDNHRLTVIASDGNDIEHVTVDSIIIQPAERYDFILNATQPSRNYWIRAKMVYESIETYAVLHYDDIEMADPESNETCLEETCIVMNCPSPYFKASESKTCLTYRDINGITKDELQQISNTNNFQEFFLNFGFPGSSPASINGKRFVFPTVSAILDPMNVSPLCENANCGEQKICICAHSMFLKSNYTVQVVLLNMGAGAFADHPIHMHGHTFHVVKVGFGTYNSTTGEFLDQNPDINCQGNTEKRNSFCNNATWSDSSWHNGNVPGLNFHNPVGKDSIVVPKGGYVVVRIIADNPGVWFLHCHIDTHMADGMAVMMNESFENVSPTPQGLPRCHNFPASITDGSNSTDIDQILYAVIGILAAIVVFLIIVTVVLCNNLRRIGMSSQNANMPMEQRYNTKF